jgi:hypothetical protein
MPEHTIRALCERSHAIAQEKGFGTNPFHTDTILMQSELAEALEDWRQHHPVNEVWYEVTDLHGVTTRVDEYIWKSVGAPDQKHGASATAWAGTMMSSTSRGVSRVRKRGR